MILCLLLTSFLVNGDVILFSKTNFREVAVGSQVNLDIRYSTENNFTKKDVYGDFSQCWLQKDAFEKFLKAEEILKQKYPGYKFLIFDCLRPRSIQKLLWAEVEKTPKQIYVADPKKGSVHNYGFAMDLSLQGPDGKELDMGTPYDDFTDKAQPAKQNEFLRSGVLSKTQIENRERLREVMEAAGFKRLSVEWWHFDALDLKTLRSKYQIVE